MEVKQVSERVGELVQESERGLSLAESRVLRGLRLRPDELQEARGYVASHPGSTAYHLLFALRRQSPEDYRRIPEDLRAKILCSALGHLIYLNDWGYLAPDESVDGEAMRALVETGAAAVPHLGSLLDDHRPAPLFGSEEATLSRMYGYRRSDFAARALAQILGLTPTFQADPVERQEQIRALNERLTG